MCQRIAEKQSEALRGHGIHTYSYSHNEWETGADGEGKKVRTIIVKIHLTLPNYLVDISFVRFHYHEECGYTRLSVPANATGRKCISPSHTRHFMLKYYWIVHNVIAFFYIIERINYRLIRLTFFLS